MCWCVACREFLGDEWHEPLDGGEGTFQARGHLLHFLEEGLQSLRGRLCHDVRWLGSLYGISNRIIAYYYDHHLYVIKGA